jgi:hypothetical protein
MLLLLLYPARKRVRALSFIGTTKRWFQAHMVLGIVGVVFAFFCYPVGIVCALVGLPLGIVARSNIAKGTAPASSNGQAVTGIVLSVIAVPISLIMMFALSGAGYYY